MSDQFIGEVRAFGYNFAPQGWATCNGQLLSIAQNPALFSIIGLTYGGDGITTFALPNLNGRIIMGAGQGTGSSFYDQGQSGGEASINLSPAQMPNHTHASINAIARQATSSNPSTTALAVTTGVNTYTNNPSNAQLSSAALGTVGGSQAHTNLMPGLGLNFCIALQGTTPNFQ